MLYYWCTRSLIQSGLNNLEKLYKNRRKRNAKKELSINSLCRECFCIQYCLRDSCRVHYTLRKYCEIFYWISKFYVKKTISYTNFQTQLLFPKSKLCYVVVYSPIRFIVFTLTRSKVYCILAKSSFFIISWTFWPSFSKNAERILFYFILSSNWMTQGFINVIY